MSKVFVIILVFALFSLEISGQECGRGTYRIIFSTTDSINYELFSLTLKGEEYYSEKQKNFLVETFFPNEKKESGFWRRQASVVKNAVAEDFLRNYKVENYENNYDFNSKKGKSKGQIILKTIETNDRPFLLQISSKKYGKSYFLGRFLGGCMLGSKIDLENQTIEAFAR